MKTIFSFDAFRDRIRVSGLSSLFRRRYYVNGSAAGFIQWRDDQDSKEAGRDCPKGVRSVAHGRTVHKARGLGATYPEMLMNRDIRTRARAEQDRVRHARLSSARAWQDFAGSAQDESPQHLVVTVLHCASRIREDAIELRPMSDFAPGDFVIYVKREASAVRLTLLAALYVLVRPAMWASIARDPRTWGYLRKCLRKDHERFIEVGCL